MIWKWRNKQAVSFKSPYMIIIGGIGFYLSSMGNILVTASGNYFKYNCMISIFCTMPIHYIGYFSLIFRAKRVFGIMILEK